MPKKNPVERSAGFFMFRPNWWYQLMSAFYPVLVLCHKLFPAFF